ncbi:MAG TPA: 2Fe-2S iron-sulfur cluster-binding protein [Polyangiaceae bacterium]|nr:2Fe-2S iron-sulfur cluster-binding protein [Polyangiaceae bacterium]
MPKIEFVENALGRAKTVDAEGGGPLVDICDASYAPIPFSCRSATCGTCQTFVLEGADCFEPPNEAEAELLSILNGRGTRLACQAVLKAGPGLVKLKSVDG